MSTSTLILYFLGFIVSKSLASIWCYHCISTQPGCGTPFNWLWHWTKVCPEEDDVCVKILEEKDGEVLITRDCLSSMRAIRTDIPADHYEGCRPAAHDAKLANYVNNSIKELDIYRNYYDKTTWCFCFLDHRCNGAQSLMAHMTMIISFSLSCTTFFMNIW
ncbi:UPAR/Ly6 domain-containing protein crim [Euwallacea similis]|uniref:UPAR/Ly6 domain-containing protein crim n=1 Tax=Euwallacea similis TaxID=1736056 RepID=UPI00344B2796